MWNEHYLVYSVKSSVNNCSFLKKNFLFFADEESAQFSTISNSIQRFCWHVCRCSGTQVRSRAAQHHNSRAPEPPRWDSGFTNAMRVVIKKKYLSWQWAGSGNSFMHGSKNVAFCWVSDFHVRQQTFTQCRNIQYRKQIIFMLLPNTVFQWPSKILPRRWNRRSEILLCSLCNRIKFMIFQGAFKRGSKDCTDKTIFLEVFFNSCMPFPSQCYRFLAIPRTMLLKNEFFYYKMETRNTRHHNVTANWPIYHEVPETRALNEKLFFVDFH